MKKILLTLAALTMSSIFMAACGGPANENAANKPANTANTANANTAATTDSSAEIKKAMTEIAAALAKNDADAAAKFYSDDYHLVTPQGVDQTKAERIADMKSGKSKFESFEYTDINVRSYGDFAVAISTVKAKGVLSGQATSGETRATLFFNKTKDGWKVVSAQATPVIAAASKPEDKKAGEEKKEGDDKKMAANKPAAPANK